jgi:hypothetical protein
MVGFCLFTISHLPFAQSQYNTVQYLTDNMNQHLCYDVAIWETHETEDECNFIIRTNDGRAFYCHISPNQFHQSPGLTEHYFKCLSLLRSGDEEQDDLYLEDVCAWLVGVFQPLVTSPAPSYALTLSEHGRPNLYQYLFPKQMSCTVDAIDDKLHPRRCETQDHGWGNGVVRVDKNFLEDVEQWTQLYDPSDVEICYDRPQDVLI